jgi:hypothetical protein
MHRGLQAIVEPRNYGGGDFYLLVMASSISLSPSLSLSLSLNICGIDRIA